MSAFGVQQGQEVVDDAGHRVGRVVTQIDRGWVVERGALIPKRFFVPFEDVARMEGDVMFLSRAPLPYPTPRDDRAPLEATELVRRIPLHDEVAVPQVRTVEASRVRVRKVVHEEERTFTVTLRKEELVVERFAPEDAPEAIEAGGSPLLDHGPVTFVLREDKVELKKYSVVREVVKLSRDRITEQREVKTTVRKEDATVEREVLPT